MRWNQGGRLNGSNPTRSFSGVIWTYWVFEIRVDVDAVDEVERRRWLITIAFSAQYY